MRKKYNIILADPPWNFRVWSKEGAGRNASKHYSVMKIKDIKALPIQNIAADNCILFMWATWPNLIEAIDTLKAWGFKYSTGGFVWMKTNKDGKPSMGMGYTTRANTEFVLIGTKGRLERQDKGVPQALLAPRSIHSEKPSEIRDRIVRLYGDLPRIELFARQKADGWDSTGLELDGADIRDYLGEY